MDVFIIFILSMKFVSFVQSAGVWCGFGGTNLKSSYKFSVSDVPDRCETIVYGYQNFDVEPSAEDTTAIGALTAAKKIVYVYYSFGQKTDWTGIMSSKDPSLLDNLIAPMIKFLNKTGVNGVLLIYLNLLAGEIPKYASKMQKLICKIKSEVASIKVGLLVSGWMASEFNNAELFDFTVTNEVVDVYVIDTTIIGSNCTATTTANGGRFPISSTDKNVVTLDQVSTDSKNSPMDQSKVMMNFADFASMKTAEGEIGKTYSQYCHRASNEIWCGDTMQLFYDGVNHVKGNFKGILISDLDEDDYDNSCGCGKFPVANTYIDAWLNKPITCCAKI